MQPKVTVAVTTYNSADYVIETLRSVFNQTYREIALVISDDCSADATVDFVQEWISDDKVKNRFLTIELITVPKNTGVSANCNRCIAASKSDWVKFIAGDDILLPNCIEDNMAFAAENPKAHIIFSQVKVYQDTFEDKNYDHTSPELFPDNLMHQGLSPLDQYRLLLVQDRIHYTPSYFFNKIALLKVGGYDETNRLVEDYPMWLKLTKSGERLYYFHKPTVGYRIHSKAANNVGNDVLFKPSVFNSYKIRKTSAHPYLPWEIAKSEQFVYWVSRFFQRMGWNKNTKLFGGLYRLSNFYLNPFHYMYAIRKRMPSNKQNPFYL
jgi:glycosyltransferase involved in cell wall biosynthesis